MSGFCGSSSPQAHQTGHDPLTPLMKTFRLLPSGSSGPNTQTYKNNYNNANISNLNSTSTISDLKCATERTQHHRVGDAGGWKQSQIPAEGRAKESWECHCVRDSSINMRCPMLKRLLSYWLDGCRRVKVRWCACLASQLLVFISFILVPVKLMEPDHYIILTHRWQLFLSSSKCISRKCAHASCW